MSRQKTATLTIKLTLKELLEGLDCTYADLIETMANEADDLAFGPDDNSHLLAAALRESAKKVRKVETLIDREPISISFGQSE